MRKRQNRIIMLDKVAIVALPLVFLLFFLYLARPKTWFNSSVDLPEASSNTADPDGEYIHVILKNGKCALVLDSAIRVPVLNEMTRKYNIKLTQQQISKFSRTEVAGATMYDMADFIDQVSPISKYLDDRFGIAVEKDNKELTDWIMFSNKQEQQINSRPLHVALLCDKNEPYANVKLMQDAIKNAGIKRIALVHNIKNIVK